MTKSTDTWRTHTSQIHEKLVFSYQCNNEMATGSNRDVHNAWTIVLNGTVRFGKLEAGESALRELLWILSSRTVAIPPFIYRSWKRCWTTACPDSPLQIRLMIRVHCCRSCGRFGTIWAGVILLSLPWMTMRVWIRDQEFNFGVGHITIIVLVQWL